MNAVLSALMLAVLASSSALLFVPQLVRLVRFGDPAGLSGSSLLFGSANYAAWNVYLADARAWGLFAANAVASLVWYAVAALALRRLRPSRSWWLPTGWALALVVVMIAAPKLLGAMLGLGALLSFTPQAVRAWSAESLAGISPATWLLTAVEGVVWLAQSLQDGLAGGALSGLITTIAAASVLAALLVRPEISGAKVGAPESAQSASLPGGPDCG